MKSERKGRRLAPKPSGDIIRSWSLPADPSLDASGRISHLLQKARHLQAILASGIMRTQDLHAFRDIVKLAYSTLGITESELARECLLSEKRLVDISEEVPCVEDSMNVLINIVELSRFALVSVNTDVEEISHTRLEKDWAALFLMATSLCQLAKDEIAKLDSTPANHPETRAERLQQHDLLQLFADGFDQIATALAAVATNPREPILLGKAAEIVASVASKFGAWWEENGKEAMGWCVKIPVFVGSVGCLSSMGANMPIVTAIVGAMVGGKDAVAGAVGAIKELKN